MGEKLKKMLVSLICLVIIIGNMDIGLIRSNGQSMQMTENKNYTADSTVYKMDFEVSSLGEYKSTKGWKLSNDTNSTIVGGKLQCKSGKSFDIRSEFNLGDEFGIASDPIAFDMLMKKGTVSVGIKLVSTVSVNDTGIWFHITNNDIRITIGGTDFEEKIKHNMALDTERKYKVTGANGKARLYISEGDNYNLVAEVALDSENMFTLKDGSGNVVGEPIQNARTPVFGLWKMTINSLDGYIDNLEYTNSVLKQITLPDSPQRVVDYSTWVATDDLNRKTPMQDETSALKDKYVGLFYFFTGDAHRETAIVDITKEYLNRGIDGLKEYLPKTPGGYWAEPYFGYYLNTDVWVIRKHVNMFEAAGIDFLFLDVSNGDCFEDALPTFFDTLLQIRKEGGQTPEVAFMTGDMPHTLVHDLNVLYDLIFTKPEYKELFFMWDGKPLILGNNDVPGGDVWTASEETIGEYPESRFWNSLSAEDREYFESGKYQEELSNFTIRKSWAWQARKYEKNNKYAGYWDYLDRWPQGAGRDFKGQIEQMPVGMACLANLSIGRSCLKNNPDYGNGKEDFEFTYGEAKYGHYFKEQFEEALKVDPKVIMITGWNEWVAGRQTNSFENFKTGHTTTPYYHFVDQLNPEFSRDGEPMKIRDGVGFGDNYYYQMVSFIRTFKGLPPLPGSPWKDVVSFNSSIKSSADVDSKLMKQWDKVKYEYMDTIGDTMFRNSDSYGIQYKYINTTGRNDIEYAKVTQDDKNMYFLAKTVLGIITEDGENWMNLFIDIDQNHETGWEGYDFVLNRSRDDKTVTVEKFVNNKWEFETVGTAEYLMGTNNLTIKVDKKLLGITGNEPNLDFKWADNSTTTGNVMQFMDLGDAAPNDRFNYRFSTKGVVPVEVDSNSKVIIIAAISAVIVVAAVIAFVVIKKKKKA